MDIREARILKIGAGGLALLCAAGFMQSRLAARFSPQFPHYHELVLGPERLQDMALLAGGFRRFAADLAWVQYLQYLGQNEDVASLGDLLGRTRRVTRLDPRFRRAYLYGASLLAWNPQQPRTEEAVALLREGIARNPSFWRLHSLLAAIAYKEEGQEAAMLASLEKTARDPQSPTILKSIVANLYKKQGRYTDALRIWLDVLDDPGAPEYHRRAASEISRLEWLRQGGK
jgi:tetratricopeptide (TPR) repeat protein